MFCLQVTVLQMKIVGSKLMLSYSVINKWKFCRLGDEIFICNSKLGGWWMDFVWSWHDIICAVLKLLPLSTMGTEGISTP
jgi:hypothetical protein